LTAFSGRESFSFGTVWMAVPHREWDWRLSLQRAQDE
jgi:hypothetical protein